MRFLSADRIFNGVQYLDDDSILVLDDQNLLKEISSTDTIPKDKIEKLEGIITPGFINAHCHLELSHLKNKIPQKTGLPAFGKEVITLRNNFNAQEISEAITAADKYMYESGIVAVGDISNTTDSFECKKTSRICYHTFVELLGFDPKNSEQIFQSGLSFLQKIKELGMRGSIAAHAPYSTSLPLINKISQFDQDNALPFSIHNQESAEETKLFMGEKSKFYDLYEFLDIDISHFKPTKKRSLPSVVDSIFCAPTLLVHNTETNASDLESLKGKEVFWCFSPGSNLYIEDNLPDFKLFADQKSQICLGTDSLASNDELDLLKEANILLKHSAMSIEDILRALTSNGARALGLNNNFGTFIINKNVGLNLLLDNNSQLQFCKKLS